MNNIKQNFHTILFILVMSHFGFVNLQEIRTIVSKFDFGLLKLDFKSETDNFQ